MRVAEVVRIALRALTRHKMRSALTVLGISIGVGAFICSVAVGEGASRQVQEQIRSLGENMIWIEAGTRNVNGVRTGTHGTRSLTQGDARAIHGAIAKGAQAVVDGKLDYKQASILGYYLQLALSNVKHVKFEEPEER